MPLEYRSHGLRASEEDAFLRGSFLPHPKDSQNSKSYSQTLFQRQLFCNATNKEVIMIGIGGDAF